MRKYTRILVRLDHPLQGANIWSENNFEENCEFREQILSLKGKIYPHIFMFNGDFLVCHSSNIFAMSDTNGLQTGF